MRAVGEGAGWWGISIVLFVKIFNCFWFIPCNLDCCFKRFWLTSKDLFIPAVRSINLCYCTTENCTDLLCHNFFFCETKKNAILSHFFFRLGVPLFFGLHHVSTQGDFNLFFQIDSYWNNYFWARRGQGYQPIKLLMLWSTAMKLYTCYTFTGRSSPMAHVFNQYVQHFFTHVQFFFALLSTMQFTRVEYCTGLFFSFCITNSRFNTSYTAELVVQYCKWKYSLIENLLFVSQVIRQLACC